MREELRSWFLEHRRAFPWREERSPYSVLVSEMMLQQTQAQVVVPYFERWMREFPSFEKLASASQERVIKAWEGLGYYARARRLHQIAQEVVAKYGGELPSSFDKIVGVGPYTRGALLSFAFGKRACAVDGNVERVISRLFALTTPVEKRETKQEIQRRVEEFLPESGAPLLMEALIELGALVCKKRPQCGVCPLRSYCIAYRDQIQETLPVKKKRERILHLHRLVGVIEHQGKVLVEKGAVGKVMEGLFYFPFIEIKKVPSKRGVQKLWEKRLELSLTLKQEHGSLSHSFTRYVAHLYPFHFEVDTKFPGEWVSIERLKELPFSSGHRQLMERL